MQTFFISKYIGVIQKGHLGVIRDFNYDKDTDITKLN